MNQKRGRAKPTIYPPPTPEELEQRAKQDAAFDAGCKAAEAIFRPPPTIYTHSLAVYDMHRHEYEIPAFQRGYVWTPDQAIAMVRRLFLGMPLGNIVVWEQPYPKPPMLMDGQQRLVTLGARVSRDGVPVVGHTVYLDYTERAIDRLLSCEPSPTRVTMAQLDRPWETPALRRLDRTDPESGGFVRSLSQQIRYVAVALTTIKDCTYQQAAQIFRCYNSGGTPIDESELPPEVTE